MTSGLTQLQAVFRCDASSSIGGGHVTRCLSLAGALADAGWYVTFVCRPQTINIVPALSDSRHALRILDDIHADERGLPCDGLIDEFDLLVVDHYELDRAFESRCRPRARRILVIDDLANRAHDCDILLDQTAGRAISDYRGLVSASCRVIVDAGYLLLNPDYATRRPEVLLRRTGRIENVLIAFGATDPGATTGRALEALEAAQWDGRIDVVIGSSTPGRDAIERITRGNDRIQLHYSPRNLVDLIAANDIAIGACGVMSWERCCLGLPTLAVISASNQTGVAGTLERTGAAYIVGWAGRDSDDVIVRNIAEGFGALRGDGQSYRSMATHAAAVCDGGGAMRMCRELQADGYPVE